MPMSGRLLRPRASGGLIGGLDADARTYLLAVKAADGQFVEPAVQTAISSFVAGCKTDGIWTAIKASCILMGARTLSGALTPLAGTAPTNNGPFVSGDYNRKTGLIGNGTSKYLDSNRNCNADPQNSFHQCVYASAVQNEIDKAFMGAGGNDQGSSQFAAAGDSGASLRRVGFRVRSSFQSLSDNAAFAGLIGASRGNSSEFVARANATSTTSATASATPFNGNILVFGRMSATGVAGLFSTHRLAFYSIGESLDLALLDSRVSTLYTAIGAAIP